MKSSTTNKILALIIAVLLWAYVMAVEKPLMTQVFEDIPIQIENEAVLLSSDLAIAETSELTTSVVLEGQRSDLKKLTAEDISASINVVGYGQGRNLVQVNVTVPDKVSVEEIKTPQVQVTIEQLIARNKPVKVNVMNLGAGTEEGAVEVVPQEIEVSGAKSKVNSVSSVQVTLDASQLAEKGTTVQLGATAVDSEGMPVENVSLSIDEVEVTAKLFRTKEVDLEVNVSGQPGNGMELASSLIPEKITIKGTKSALKDISSIQAKPVDISGITDNTAVMLEPILPEGVEVARSSSDLSATFNLRDIMRKEFTYSSNEIIIESLSSDYTLSIETSTIRVMVSGPQNIMDTLTKSDLVPVLHADGVDISTASLPVSISYDKRLNSVSVQPSSVNVVVEKSSIVTNPGQTGGGNGAGGNGDASGGTQDENPGTGSDNDEGAGGE